MDEKKVELRAPANAPHPLLGCRCSEGRVLDEKEEYVVRWLPGVHDCIYIAGVNALRGAR